MLGAATPSGIESMLDTLGMVGILLALIIQIVFNRVDKWKAGGSNGKNNSLNKIEKNTSAVASWYDTQKRGNIPGTLEQLNENIQHNTTRTVEQTTVLRELKERIKNCPHNKGA